MVDADMMSCCIHALVLSIVADLIVGMEDLELHCRCRGRSNLRKIRIASISVRMVSKKLNRKQEASNLQAKRFHAN